MIDLFTDSLSRAVRCDLDLMELVGASARLNGAGELHFSAELYRVWIKYNANDPHVYAARFNYAASLLRLSKLHEAKAILSESIQAHPDFFPSYILLGDVLTQLALVDEAIACWQQVVDRLEARQSLVELDLSQAEHQLTALMRIGAVRWRTESALREALGMLRPILTLWQSKNASGLDVEWKPEAVQAAQALIAVTTEAHTLFPGT